MKTLASRFLSFEETLGAGLVKFAYFVLLAVLIVLLAVGMITGIVMMFTVGFWAGLGVFLLTPIRFLIALILLRVATEVVLAILSIDDQLTDGVRTEGALPSLVGSSSAASGAASSAAPASARSTAKAASTTAAKPTAKKATKKTAKKTTAGNARKTSSASVQKTTDAAKAATRPKANEDPAKAKDGDAKPSGDAT